ncbi:MAG: transcription-repair coupling factor [Candidatus Cloacimonetes bacterium]|nr:transcription-repair coupling factor [Candidatus Cloacimonadota bacterium]
MSLENLFDQFEELPIYQHKGFHGSSYTFYLLKIFDRTKKDLLLEMPSEESARHLVNDLRQFLPKEEVLFYPEYDRLENELLPPNALTIFERLTCLKSMILNEKPLIVVTTKSAVSQQTIPPGRFRELSKGLVKGKNYNYDQLIETLVHLGYHREEMVASRGDFSVRGDILDIFLSTEDQPIRCEFFGDELDALKTFDLYTQRSIENLEKATIHITKEFDMERFQLVETLDPIVQEYFESRSDSSFDDLAHDVVDGVEWLNPYVKSSASLLDYRSSFVKPRLLMKEFNIDGVTYFGKNMQLLLDTLEQKVDDGFVVYLFLPKGGFLKRVHKLLDSKEVYAKKLNSLHLASEKAGVYLLEKSINGGFEIQSEKLLVVSYSDFTGSPYQNTKKKKKVEGLFEGDILHHFSELKVDEYVVHTDHGVAQFKGIENLIIDGIKKEYLALAYQGSDRVLVPITEVNRIHRFTASDGRQPKLNKLNSVRWTQVKSKVKKDVEIYAKEVLALSAKRTLAKGFKYSTDTELMEEMESAFEYEETKDQLKVIEEIKLDMQRQHPMERLLCGDVGYGKTEVAIRAAFKSTQDNKQVAVLCPTTILSQQHFQTFQSRLMGYPVRIEVLNRFVSAKKTREILRAVAEHKVDILVGTHRLLSKDVKFDDLGLMIVDEEQRFGVKNKEKLKNLKAGVDSLTLSATPIPRTLHMSLGGVRAISLINTPPVGRLPIKTFVLPYQEQTIKEAIERELKRNGQVFYIYNRVETIEMRASSLLKIIPGLRLKILHGQMSATQIEEVMTSFMRREFDILLATTIVESGMDIPNVNTLLVERADAFGLSQLYQLRGRVGRRNIQGYTYLFHKKDESISQVARKRLSALEEFTDLGSGFKIAMRDLEIRGAGNLIGKAQSGFVYNIGFDLYSKLLRDSIEKLQNSNYREDIELPIMELRVSSYVSEKYIPSYRERMDFFRRVSNLTSKKALESLKEELFDRYGGFSKDMHLMFRLVELRIYGYKLLIKRFRQIPGSVSLEFYNAVPQYIQKEAKDIYKRDYSYSDRFPNVININIMGLNPGDVLEKLFLLINESFVLYFLDQVAIENEIELEE